MFVFFFVGFVCLFEGVYVCIYGVLGCYVFSLGLLEAFGVMFVFFGLGDCGCGLFRVSI